MASRSREGGACEWPVGVERGACEWPVGVERGGLVSGQSK